MKQLKSQGKLPPAHVICHVGPPSTGPQEADLPEGFAEPPGAIPGAWTLKKREFLWKLNGSSSMYYYIIIWLFEMSAFCCFFHLVFFTEDILKSPVFSRILLGWVEAKQAWLSLASVLCCLLSKKYQNFPCGSSFEMPMHPNAMSFWRLNGNWLEP